jgi:hypothetical protein
MMAEECFPLEEAQALQGQKLYAMKNVNDEHNRVFIPQAAICHVIGLDMWDEDLPTGCIAVQFTEDGWLPKVVLMNKTTYEEHFENVSVEE